MRAPTPFPARRAAFTIVELLAATAMLIMLAVSANALLQVVTRRLAADRTRHLLAAENARTAQIVSELARRATRVRVFATRASASASDPVPAARGDVLAFDLPDGTSRWVTWENGTVALYVNLTEDPAVLAGGEPGRTVSRVGTDPHCEYVQGLPRAVWLARASTPRGWTEEITYSAFAVALQGR